MSTGPEGAAPASVSMPRWHCRCAVPSGARNFIDSPLYGLFGIRSGLADATLPNTGELGGYWIRQPSDPVA